MSENRQMDRLLNAVEQFEELLELIRDAADQIIGTYPFGSDPEMIRRANVCTEQAQIIRHLSTHAMMVASVERLRIVGESRNGSTPYEIYEYVVPAPAFRDSPETIERITDPYGAGRG